MDKKAFKRRVILESVTTACIVILTIYNGFSFLTHKSVTIFGYISYIANVIALIALVFEWYHVIKIKKK